MKEIPEVKCLFSVPVYQTRFELDKDVLKYLINSELEYMQDVKNGHMSKNKFILNNKKLKKLKNQITKHAEIFFHQVLKINEKCKLYMTNSWITKHGKNDHTQVHRHSNSVLTAIYYFKNTKGAGNLHLHRPDMFTLLPCNFQFEHSSFNMLNAVSYSIEPFDGLLIIIPSHLQHSAGLNKTNKYRYLISADFYVKGKIGIGDFSLKL